MPGFKGLKITQDRGTPRRFPDVHRVRCRPGVNELLFDMPGEIGWGGNGGFHMLNLAIQFGASRVVLIGFDMGLRKGYHWHGRHPGGLTNPTQGSTDKWRERLDAQRGILDLLGIPVVLGSPGSALQNFPTLPLKEAIYGNPPRLNR